MIFGMQGYILNLNRVKDEDLIVSILSESQVYTTYRFYGARHSIINVGYKIDFELESNYKSSIPRLKDVLHIGYSWIFDKQKLYCWQRFIKLFYPHLKDVEELDPFYFQLLNDLTKKMEKQSPQRACIESYILLCEHEGRLHEQFECLLCEKPIEKELSLVRSFVPTHPMCSYSKSFELFKIEKLFQEKNSISLSDEEIEYLWNVLLQGL